MWVSKKQKNYQKSREKNLSFSSVFLLSQDRSVTSAQRFVWEAKHERDRIPTATLNSRVQQHHCSAVGEVWGDIQSITHVLLSADEWWWQCLAALPGLRAQKAHHIRGRRHRASSQILNSDSSLTSIPWATDVVWQATGISTVSTLTILSKFLSSSVPVVYLCMISGNTGWIVHCRQPELATQNSLVRILHSVVNEKWALLPNTILTLTAQ